MIELKPVDTKTQLSGLIGSYFTSEYFYFWLKSAEGQWILFSYLLNSLSWMRPKTIGSQSVFVQLSIVSQYWNQDLQFIITELIKYLFANLIEISQSLLIDKQTNLNFPLLTPTEFRNWFQPIKCWLLHLLAVSSEKIWATSDNSIFWLSYVWYPLKSP